MIRALVTVLMTVVSLAAMADDVDVWLDRLDATIGRHATYIEAREHTIDSLRIARHPSAFAANMAMQRAFMSYSLDSAISRGHAARAVASTPAEIAEADIALARAYNSSGVMYKEAADLFHTIDRHAIEGTALLSDYYSLGVQLNRNLASHSLDSDLRDMYLSRKVAYRDSSLLLDPDNSVLLANRYIDSGNYSSAIDILTADCPDGLTTPHAAVVYSILAQVYAEQGNRQMAKKYLAQSARCDIGSGTREYLSLPRLAMMLYEDGDYSRAHSYIHRSISDADACNAKMRLLKMALDLSVIDRAVQEQDRKNSYTLVIFLLITIMMAGMLFVMFRYSRQRNKRLAADNAEQEKLNKRLKASDRLKEEYITRFMSLSLDYLAQMESYRRNLLKIAANKSLDQLCDAIKSERYISTGISDFYEHFDNAFLNLFPSFVSDVQQLLRPGYVFNTKRGERLNTELRILALMRLGYTDTDTISRFLRCSRSTVYNYRTRLRAAAHNPSTFESAIEAINR